MNEHSRESDGASFLLNSQITNILRNATLAFKMFAFYVSLGFVFRFLALFFVSFSSATKAVADPLQAVFLALIMHRCCG